MDLAFGLTMATAGIAITLITLYLLTLIISLMNKLFPFKEEPAKKNK